MSNKLIRIIFSLLVITLMVPAASIGQSLTDRNWYFGNSSEYLRFSKDSDSAQVRTEKFSPYGIGGGVTVNEETTGDLLFYSDGQALYDALDNEVTNTLAGDNSINQAATVFSNQDGTFTLFTNDGINGTNGIRRTVISKTASPNTGNISQLNTPDQLSIVSENEDVLLSNPTDGMILIETRRDNHYLISQDSASMDIIVARLDPTGVIVQRTAFMVFDAMIPSFRVSNFSFHQDSSLLALSAMENSRNILILDVVDSTGALNVRTTLPNTANNDNTEPAIYDTEWSPDGNQLFWSRFGTNGGMTAGVFRFSLSDSSVNVISSNSLFRSFGLQMGPDSMIYHLYQSTLGSEFLVGRIENPGAILDSIVYDADPFEGTDFGGQQFPVTNSSIFSMFDELSFTVVDTCFSENTMGSNATRFFANVNPTPTSVMWDFGDGQTSEAYAPLYTYMAAGVYAVSLTAEIDGERQTVTRMVNIVANTAMVDIGVDTTICPGEQVEMDATVEGEAGASYGWNVGATTPMITVDSSGTYWVGVTLANGCTLYDERTVTVFGDTTEAGTIWYFGEEAGLDFRNGNLVALTDGAIISQEGAAVISDDEGDLQFYTNGETVWNKDHEEMVNGLNIGGDPESTQSALIVKASRDEDETQYYIFTTTATSPNGPFALKYSLVDMKLDSAKGAVVIKDQLLLDNSTEKLTATGFEDDVWLIAHEYGNAVYRAYPITDEGIGEPVLSDVGSVHGFDDVNNAIGYLKFSAEAGAIAAAIPGDDDLLEILSFDTNTGEISDPITINIQVGDIYGVEFSGDGNKLYTTTNNGPGSVLLQYDLDSLNSEDPAADIARTREEIFADGQNFGALQRGPRGTIYMAVEGSTALGSIPNPNADADMTGFSIDAVDLAGKISRLGLPNFTQDISSPPPQPGIGVDNACLGTDAIFNGTGASDIDEFAWTFGDGTGAMVEDTTHLYDIIGVYNVTLNVSNRCGLDTTFFETVRIDSLPLSPTLPGNDFFCTSGTLTLEALSPELAASLLFSWNTGETTRTIDISDPGSYSVTITDTLGCSSLPDTVVVVDGRPFLDLENDRFFCQNENVAPLDDGNSPPKIREWFIDDISTGNRFAQQDINTGQVGAFEYKVVLEDEISGCISVDSILVTIGGIPGGTFIGSPTSGCGNNDGEISITIDQVNGEVYNFSVANISGSPILGETVYPGMTFPVTGLTPNSYVVTIADATTGCDTIVNIPVSDQNPNFQFDLTQTGTCEPDLDIAVDLTILRDSMPQIDVTVSNIAGLNEVRNNTDSADFEIADRFGINLPPSQYTVVITHANCTLSENITLSTDPLVMVNFDPMQNLCPTAGDQETITYNSIGSGLSTANLQFQWLSPANTSLGNDSFAVAATSGQYVLNTTPDAGVPFCPSSDTIAVIVNQKPTVAIDISGDPCEGQLALTAVFTSMLTDEASDYQYLWTLEGNTPFIAGSMIEVTEDGLDSVRVFNSISGCEAETSTLVDVHTPVNVVIEVEQDCDEDPNVTLTGISNFNAEVTTSWLKGTEMQNPDVPNVLIATESDQYTYTVTDTMNNCSGSDVVDITIMPLILPGNVLIPPRVFICSLDDENGDFTYTGFPDEFTYTWKLVSNDSVVSRDNPFTVTSGGNYKVEITNGFDCLEFPSTVQDNCLPRIEAPNAFSPDNNGINDFFFVIPNDYVDQFKISIFNRWGELVYKSDDIAFEWNGELEGAGARLPVGNYAYKMEFTSSLAPNMGVIEQRGGIAIVK